MSTQDWDDDVAMRKTFDWLNVIECDTITKECLADNARLVWKGNVYVSMHLSTGQNLSLESKEYHDKSFVNVSFIQCRKERQGWGTKFLEALFAYIKENGIQGYVLTGGYSQKMLGVERLRKLTVCTAITGKLLKKSIKSCVY